MTLRTHSANQTNPYTGLTGANYAAQLATLLPPGPALSGPNVALLLAGLAAQFGDVQASASQLSELELAPQTTSELLAAWLADWGLPDCCVPLGASVGQQRAALLAKIAAVGGATPAYFVAVAAALGWTITIDEGAPGSFTWTVHAAAVAPVELFRAGENVAGDLLESFQHNTELECVLDHIKPAHTILLFSYP